MVSTVKMTGAPEILQKQRLSGRYAWKISMPILLIYQPATRPAIQTPMRVTLIVVRVPVKDSPQRIAINNFLPELLSPGGGTWKRLN